MRHLNHIKICVIFLQLTTNCQGNRCTPPRLLPATEARSSFAAVVPAGDGCAQPSQLLPPAATARYNVTAGIPACVAVQMLHVFSSLFFPSTFSGITFFYRRMPFWCSVAQLLATVTCLALVLQNSNLYMNQYSSSPCAAVHCKRSTLCAMRKCVASAVREDSFPLALFSRVSLCVSLSSDPVRCKANQLCFASSCAANILCCSE